jgi:enamine deaminase RidA (YjgF/YER057c/UK114 family)
MSEKEHPTSPVLVEYINPGTLPRAIGYSHSVKVTGGALIFVSGQIPLNHQGELVGAGDLRKQSEQVFENIRAVLKESGATMSHLIKLTYYVVNLQLSDSLMLRELRESFLDQTHPPVSTMVGVMSLFDPRWLIEIEAVALIP